MTDSERQLLEALTVRVPLLSTAQVTRTWFSTKTPAAVRRIIQSLQTKGWLEAVPVLAYPELDLQGPFATWSPGDPLPPFGHLAHFNRKRWDRTEQRETVLVATRQAAKLFGGNPGEAKPLHISHDLNLGGVFLHFLRHRPDEASRWVSETTLAPEREDDVLPDAAIRSLDGTLERVVEFVGTSYTAERLEDLFLDAKRRRMAIEYW